MSDKIYVCEWSQKDLSFADEGIEYDILRSYDYTYHTSLEQAQEIVKMNWRGYAWAKGLIENQDDAIIDQKFHKTIKCISIWIYADNLVVGKYELNTNGWIYSVYNDGWDEDWPEMISLPVPLIEI